MISQTIFVRIMLHVCTDCNENCVDRCVRVSSNCFRGMQSLYFMTAPLNSRYVRTIHTVVQYENQPHLLHPVIILALRLPTHKAGYRYAYGTSRSGTAQSTRRSRDPTTRDGPGPLASSVEMGCDGALEIGSSCQLETPLDTSTLPLQILTYLLLL
jgi:hypothetical protein